SIRPRTARTIRPPRVGAGSSPRRSPRSSCSSSAPTRGSSAAQRSRSTAGLRMTTTTRWRQLLDERLAEAISTFGAVPGVRGLILAGSVGRGEPWPLSDIDILPISAEGFDIEAEIERRRASLVDWWAASARAQTLDVGWLRFTDQEVGHAIGLGAAETAQLMADPRWFHGMDKAYGGRGAADSD